VPDLARALVRTASVIAAFVARVTLPLIIVLGAIQGLARNFRWNLGVDLRREVSVTGRGLC